MKERYLLCETDEVLVVRVHVRELAINQQNQLLLTQLLALPDVRRYDTLRLLPQSGITRHLQFALRKNATCRACVSWPVFFVFAVASFFTYPICTNAHNVTKFYYD